MDRPLRILVVQPFYGGSLPIAHYCQSALSNLGHVAEGFESPAFYPAFTAVRGLGVAGERQEMLENSFVQVVSQAILAKVESFEPDLVLALAQAPLTRQALKRLKDMGVATAMWFVEDHTLFTYWLAYAPYYDVFAVIQKEPFLGELAAIGVDHALYLPLAADPAFHRPLALTPEETRELGAPVSFLGAGYPNRRLAFHRLIKHGLKIWGTEWDGDPVLAPFVQRSGARIDPAEAVKIYNATRINLNLHSSVKVEELVSGGDFVNPRTFELAACGAFQLVDRRSLLPELFGEGDLATFASLDELSGLIEHYLARPEERQAMARRARERVMAEHTYERRMEALIDFTTERLPGLGAGRVRDEGFEALPEPLKGSLGELLAGLKLPARASFKDVVLAIRGRQGVLSELEALVLFLDEWRKQYAAK